MKWVKRGLQYFCVVVLTLEQQNKPKQTPVCMGSMSNVDGDVKQPYRRPSVCGSGRLAETTLFFVSLSDTVVLLWWWWFWNMLLLLRRQRQWWWRQRCRRRLWWVCVSVFCLILRFLFLSWRLDFSHTEAIRPTGKLRYFTKRERIHVVRDFQFQLRFLPIYDNTLCTTTYFYWFKVRQNSYSQRKCQLIFEFYLPRIPDCFCKCVWVYVRVWAEKKTSPKRKL